jgi:hypothetical protein
MTKGINPRIIEYSTGMTLISPKYPKSNIAQFKSNIGIIVLELVVKIEYKVRPCV